MASIKRIVCLANSRKLSGRCIAGIEQTDVGGRLGWVRPVSAREHEEVSERERHYEDGSDPRVLDVMLVPLLGPRPKGYQQENWLLDSSQSWKLAGRAAWSELDRLTDPSGPLWINGNTSYNGLNDKIPLAQATRLTSSLRLVKVGRMTLSVFKPGEDFGDSKRRVQGRFEHQGVEYRLWVTDPRYERAYLQKEDGDYEVGESFITVSLGEPYNGACYKLIAAVMERANG